VTRPPSNSQAGKILKLLEDAGGGKVSLPAILNLRISQYSARIHDLRHRFGFVIQNGAEEGHPDRTWFKLVGRNYPATDRLTREMNEAIHRDDSLEARRPPATLFGDISPDRSYRE